jgi:pimeloyl-ACP methyl ester carboxylesterase
LIASARIRAAGAAVGAFLERLGLKAGPDLAEMARGYASLGDAGARQAFIHTLRAVIDPGGQRVSATDRLYLAEDMPSLIVWGRRDPLIPVEHAEIAHRAMPGSRLEIFDDAGHFPQLDDPIAFAGVLRELIDSTQPYQLDMSADEFDQLRGRLLAGRRAPTG